MNNIAIVVVGYNRVDSISRLINSLLVADYKNDNVDLILSIDNSGTDLVENYAKSITWNHGEKIIRTFPERQGLRNHILQCGKFTENYRGIIVLEDDVVVSKDFYNYSKQAIEFYEKEDDIAGISLYSTCLSIDANRTFIPDFSPYDNYFLQYAQSWGQIWIKDSWNKFISWYSENFNKELHSDNFPVSISNWSNKSWLKYHIKYCVENNKYFVYPYKSFTTCFAEAGEHELEKNSIFQVPLSNEANKKYLFCLLSDKNISKYDVFYERQDLDNYLGISNVLVDLYGRKFVNEALNEDYNYLLSSKKLNYKIEKSFALDMRPHEANIINNIRGYDIFLYNLKETKKFPKDIRINIVLKLIYYQKLNYTIKILTKILFHKIKVNIRRRF